MFTIVDSIALALFSPVPLLFFWAWACIIDGIRRKLWDGRTLGIEMNCMISLEFFFFSVWRS